MHLICLLSGFLILSCNGGTMSQAVEEAVDYNDSLLLPVILPHPEAKIPKRDFPEPLYPLLPLSPLDDPCWNCADILLPGEEDE